MSSSDSAVDINALSHAEAAEAFVRCCGSPAFGELMARARPFQSHGAMVAASRRVWHTECTLGEWKLAFEAHPVIGDVSQLREKFASTAQWCEGEQSAALASSNEATLLELQEWNRKYEEKFGHIFIICASGKPAHEILAALKERYPNSPYAEYGITAEEQQKITELRLEKLQVSFDAGPKSRVGTIASQMSGSATAKTPPPGCHMAAPSRCPPADPACTAPGSGALQARCSAVQP